MALLRWSKLTYWCLMNATTQTKSIYTTWSWRISFSTSFNRTTWVKMSPPKDPKSLDLLPPQSNRKSKTNVPSLRTSRKCCRISQTICTPASSQSAWKKSKSLKKTFKWESSSLTPTLTKTWRQSNALKKSYWKTWLWVSTCPKSFTKPSLKGIVRSLLIKWCNW